MSVCPSVRLKLKTSVTAEPNGLYSSGNITTGPVVVLSYFLWRVEHPQSLPPQPYYVGTKKFFFFYEGTFFKLTLWVKQQRAKGDAGSKIKIINFF